MNLVVNGNLSDEDVVTLDSGFYFGRGLFETMLIKKSPVLLNFHLDRINKGLKILDINKNISENEVMDAVSKLKCRDEVLKLTVTEKNTLFTKRKNNYTEERYNKGFKLTISENKRNPYSTFTYLKSLNYAENIIEHEKCMEKGYNEVIFFNTEGFLAEGSISNIFFIKDNIIYTPSVECGLLNGTIRKYLMDRYNVVQGKFTHDDFMKAEGAFLTNSIMGIMKVTSINNKAFYENALIKSISKDYNNYIKNYE